MGKLVKVIMLRMAMSGVELSRVELPKVKLSGMEYYRMELSGCSSMGWNSPSGIVKG